MREAADDEDADQPRDAREGESDGFQAWQQFACDEHTRDTAQQRQRRECEAERQQEGIQAVYHTAIYFLAGNRPAALEAW